LEVSALYSYVSDAYISQVSGSNVVSVAEHVVMSILLLVRNFVPAHEVLFQLIPMSHFP
jgi:phosphoglycerate dehydrogenase-like enzyme